MLCDNRSLQTVSTRASEQRREDRSDRFDENKLTRDQGQQTGLPAP